MKRVLLKFSVIFAFCLVLAGLLFTPPNQLSKGIPFTFAKVKSDESAVYSILLKELFIKDDMKSLIISKNTMWYGDFAPNLNYNLDISVKYILIDGADYNHKVLINESEEKKDSRPKLTDLIEKYPDPAYVALSKIKFNEEKNEAFVYVESFGQGRTVVLKKESGFWKIEKTAEVWIS